MDRLNLPVSLDVTQLELGPIGTNCYLVRSPGAGEAVVVDPGGDAAEIRGEARVLRDAALRGATTADKLPEKVPPGKPPESLPPESS